MSESATVVIPEPMPLFGPVQLAAAGFLARRAGIEHHVGCHALRHAFITAALDARVPLRDVQIAARHADPRPTTRYDRARGNLDRHANYVVATFIAGPA